MIAIREDLMPQCGLMNYNTMIAINRHSGVPPTESPIQLIKSRQLLIKLLDRIRWVNVNPSLRAIYNHTLFLTIYYNKVLFCFLLYAHPFGIRGPKGSDQTQIDQQYSAPPIIMC